MSRRFSSVLRSPLIAYDIQPWLKTTGSNRSMFSLSIVRTRSSELLKRIDMLQIRRKSPIQSRLRKCCQKRQLQRPTHGWLTKIPTEDFLPPREEIGSTSVLSHLVITIDLITIGLFISQYIVKSILRFLLKSRFVNDCEPYPLPKLIGGGLNEELQRTREMKFKETEEQRCASLPDLVVAPA